MLGLAIFVVFFALTMRRGATDPVCGMKVDRARALTTEHAGHSYYFCSQDCRGRFEADPDRYGAGRGRPGDPEPAAAH